MSATDAPAPKKVAAPKKAADHPPVAVMVDAAIAALKERSGSSLAAIKKYIAANYKVDVAKLKTFIKNYIKKSVASGKLTQTKGTGAAGSFKLAKVEKPKKKVVKKEKAAKKPKATPKKPKAKKAAAAKSPKKTPAKKPAKAKKAAATPKKAAAAKKPAAKKPAAKKAATPKKPAAKKPAAKKPAAKKPAAKKAAKK